MAITYIHVATPVKNENGKFVALDLDVVASLLHLWANFITFMISGFITFVVKSCYIYG